VIALACLVIAAELGTSSPPAGAAALSDKLVPCNGALFGVSQGPPRGGRRPGEEIGYLEGLIDRRFDLDRAYYKWEQHFPGRREQDAVAAGRIPVIGWVARKKSGAVIPWAAIAAGRYDGMIQARADAIRSFSHQVMFIFHHEPESDVDEIGSPAQFAAAFRRVVSIFRARGATNAVPVWTMTAQTFDPGGRVPEDFYPGDDVVDWVAADGYNWYGSRHLKNRPWEEFATVFGAFNQWAAARGKPAMIAEMGALEDSTKPPDPLRKANWFLNLAATAKSWPNLKAISYFQGFGWHFDSSTAAVAGYRAIASDPYFNPRSQGPITTVSLRRRVSRLVALRGLPVRLTLNCPGQVVIELRAGRRLVAQSVRNVQGQVRLRIKPSRRGRRILRRTRARRLRVIVRASGQQTEIRQSLRLQARRRR